MLKYGVSTVTTYRILYGYTVNAEVRAMSERTVSYESSNRGNNHNGWWRQSEEHKQLILNNTRTDETVWSRMIWFGIVTVGEGI